MLSFLNFRRSEGESDMPTSKRLAGPGFIILNVIRAMNITGLLAACVASFIMLIKTFTASQFFFFDGATHVITALSSMFLVVSECSIFRRWFERNWPVLSNSHGFNFLGLGMIVIGNNLLGNLNKEATSQENLGMPFWRIVIGAGVIVFAMGFINIIASLIFRDRKLKVTARQIRSKGAVAISDKEAQLISDKAPGSIVTSFPNSSYAPSSNYSQASPIKVVSPVRRFMHNARQSILPSYRSEVPPYPRSPPPAATMYPSSPLKSPSAAVKAISKNDTGSTHDTSSPGPSTSSNNSGGIMEISAPLNVNPQFAHLVRPRISQHPSQRRPDGSF